MSGSIEIKQRGGGGLVTKESTILASASDDVDSIDLLYNTACKWFIKLGIVGKSEIKEIFAREESGDIKYSEYGILGDSIDYDLVLIESGGLMKLNITNNETESLLVNIVRFPF